MHIFRSNHRLKNIFLQFKRKKTALQKETTTTTTTNEYILNIDSEQIR